MVVKQFSDRFVAARFLEQDKAQKNPNRFKVALIQEGMGNLNDRFYYTREALESAVKVFEGKKLYIDHPSRSEDQDRPERSVRDIGGHYENLRIEDNKDGCAMLVAEANTLPGPAYDWTRTLMQHAIEYGSKYPDKEFVGLSINANGESDERPLEEFLKEATIPEGAKAKLLFAREMGITSIRPVTRFTDAVSADMVTEAGARGEILNMLERESEMAKTKKESEGGDHPDASKDLELIKSELKKNLPPDASDVEMEQATQACEAFKSMGKNDEEAMKCAGDSIKLSRHMTSKQETDSKKEQEMADKKEQEKKEADLAAAKKESEENLVKIQGRVAFLEGELKKTVIEKHIDKKLRESKLPRSATDKLRQVLGEPKTEAEVDEKLKIFQEAYSVRGSESANIFTHESEKNGGTQEKPGFGDCVSE